MFRRRAQSNVLPAVMDTVKKISDENEPLRRILTTFRQASVPFSDTDECIEEDKNHVYSGKSQGDDQGLLSVPKVPSSSGPTVLTYRGFAASLVCPKKFYLIQNRVDLPSDISIGEAVHMEDGASFNELARRWDRLQFGSKAVVVHEQDYAQAVKRTEETVVNYFQTVYAQLGEQAPSLTIHRPAFTAPFGKMFEEAKKIRSSSSPLLLRARPAVLRFRPKDNQWVILETAATVDPLSNTARLSQYLQRLHFTTVVFRHWITQPHIPIHVRKRLLDIDLDTVTENNLKGNKLEASAQISVPLDLKRSGLLHIRQFFPGPVSLVDCDPSRLVKYVQRLSLEDMLDADRNANQKTGAMFGMCSFDGIVESEVAKLQSEVGTLLERAQGQLPSGSNTSSKAAKKRDAELRNLFSTQQKLVEALIGTHTHRLIEMGRDAENVRKWSAFSLDQPGCVVPTFDADDEELGSSDEDSSTGKRSKKSAGLQNKKSKKSAREIPSIPVYSEFLGAHCSRGDVCPFFSEGMCLPNRFEDPLRQHDNHLFTVPTTTLSRKAVWWSQGLRTVRDVLYQHKRGTLKLTPSQLRYVKAIVLGKLFVNPREIDDFFSRIRYPAFLIDFEATQFAMPPFEKVVAFQPVPFQFSLDVFQEDILTETPVHYDYLHFGKGYSPNADPRRGCLDELMRIVHLEREKKRISMEASGELERLKELKRIEEEANAALLSTPRRGRIPKKPKTPNITKNNPLDEPVNPYDGCFIAHFASFEKSCLEKLGQLVDDYKEDIKQFYFLDTLDLFKRGFIHPNASGSNSLKKVLPALCPDFQYGVFGGESAGGAIDEDGSGAGGRQDEQKGENVMGVYRLWYHHEGGGTLKDYQLNSARSSGRVDANSEPGVKQVIELPMLQTRQDVREKAWAMLRIQLLEYCSLDTKGLYEIMRQVWQEKEAAKNLKTDKGGWVMTEPQPREYNL
uniref:DUF2779 domain-containing protein n=1 Tax=Trypanosoma vivax (strain Y486) TaxID=1055687 RepID=G0UBN7_TRYVY|nr:conserved hypothetical protein [Trypanosoma vivax Y486]